MTVMVTAARTLPPAKPVHEIVMPLVGKSPARIIPTNRPGLSRKKSQASPNATRGRTTKLSSIARATGLPSATVKASRGLKPISIGYTISIVIGSTRPVSALTSARAPTASPATIAAGMRITRRLPRPPSHDRGDGKGFAGTPATGTFEFVAALTPTTLYPPGYLVNVMFS